MPYVSSNDLFNRLRATDVCTWNNLRQTKGLKMTKKSFARVQRDLMNKEKTKSAKKMQKDYFKNNRGWDEAKEVYDSNCNMVIGTGEIIRNGFSDKEIFKYFNSHEVVEVNTAINGMNNDLMMFTDKLVQIGQLHRQRSGPVTDEKDFELLLQIVDDYTNFATRFSSVVSPNQNFLVDKLGVAMERRAQAEAVDTSVVTDVLVKEDKEETQ